MRTKSWRQDLDKQATLEAYVKARKDEAFDLAQRIRVANSEKDFDLTKDFDLLDKQAALIPVDRPEGWDA